MGGRLCDAFSDCGMCVVVCGSCAVCLWVVRGVFAECVRVACGLRVGVCVCGVMVCVVCVVLVVCRWWWDGVVGRFWWCWWCWWWCWWC